MSINVRSIEYGQRSQNAQMDQASLFHTRDHLHAHAGLLARTADEHRTVGGLPHGAGRHGDDECVAISSQLRRPGQGCNTTVDRAVVQGVHVAATGAQPNGGLLPGQHLVATLVECARQHGVNRVGADVDRSDRAEFLAGGIAGFVAAHRPKGNRATLTIGTVRPMPPSHDTA